MPVRYETRSHRIAVEQNPRVAKRRHSLAQHVSAGIERVGKTESALADDTSFLTDSMRPAFLFKTACASVLPLQLLAGLSRLLFH